MGCATMCPLKPWRRMGLTTVAPLARGIGYPPMAKIVPFAQSISMTGIQTSRLYDVQFDHTMGLARQGSPLDWRSDHSAVAGTRLVDDPYGTATGPVSTLCRAFRTWVRFSGAHYAAPVVAIVQSHPGPTSPTPAVGAA